MKNPNCDNEMCRTETGEVRVLPSGGDSNLILCRACFNYEIFFRRDRNKYLSEDAQFDLPTWKELGIYLSE
jgi:hypothetical protein